MYIWVNLFTYLLWDLQCNVEIIPLSIATDNLWFFDEGLEGGGVTNSICQFIFFPNPALQLSNPFPFFDFEYFFPIPSDQIPVPVWFEPHFPGAKPANPNSHFTPLRALFDMYEKNEDQLLRFPGSGPSSYCC